MKDFILIANVNCVLYNEVFPYIKEKKIQVGHTHIHHNGEGHFLFYTHEGKLKDIDNSRWLTTLPVNKEKKLKIVSTAVGKNYDNYPAINCDTVKDIPQDYYGNIGTSIYVLNYDLQEWEIVDKLIAPIIEGKKIYKRIIIKKVYKNGNKQEKLTEM